MLTQYTALIYMKPCVEIWWVFVSAKANIVTAVIMQSHHFFHVNIKMSEIKVWLDLTGVHGPLHLILTKYRYNNGLL